MAWQYGQAQQRIRKLIDEAPEIDVRRFADEYMPLYEARKAVLKAANESVAPPLFDLQKGRAVVVDTVQITSRSRTMMITGLKRAARPKPLTPRPFAFCTFTTAHVTA
jgi:hypothetical protein